MGTNRTRRLWTGVITSLLLAGTAAASAPAAPPVIVHAGELLETPGRDPIASATLIVVDGKVQSVRQGFVGPEAVGLPPQTRVIDLSHMFVMPGFIDLHVHLS